MLCVVGSNLKMVKFFMHRSGMLLEVVVVARFRTTMLLLGMCTGSIFNTQHIATSRNRMAKRAHHVAPNKVGMCCVQMLRSFGRGFKAYTRMLKGRMDHGSSLLLVF